MQQWEHVVIQIAADQDLDWGAVVARLDEFGNDGWELVSYGFRPIVNLNSSTSLGNVFWSAGAEVDAVQGPTFAIFKRPRAA